MPLHLPAHVANAFLFLANKEGIAIDQLKIQKLVYFLYGWHLAIRRVPPIGEFFEAWPYGPVLSSLYHEFKKFGSSPIEGYALEIDPHSGEYRSLMVSPDVKAFYEILNPVWDRYKGYSGLALSSMTHATGTPWRTARDKGDSYLSNEEIERYFERLANKG